MIVGIELLVTGGRVGALWAHPHPYWLVVLPMAAGHGAVAGLLAALVATALQAVGLEQAGQLDMTRLLELEPIRQGIVFLGVAFLVGEIHDSHAARFYALGRRLDRLRAQRAQLEHERGVLEAATHHLRRQLLERPLLRARLLEASVRMETTSREAALATILELIGEQCGASMTSVWKVESDRQIHLLRTAGWSGDEEAERIEVVRSSERVVRCVQEACVANGLLPGQEPGPKEPVMIAPIADAQGVLWGLLCLDEIEPVYLNTETTSIFFGLAGWMAAVLARIEQQGEVPKDVGDVEGTEALGERLWLEYDCSVRYGCSLAILCIRAGSGRPQEAEERAAADRAVASALAARGGAEHAYRFGYPGCYAVVLSAFEDADAATLEQGIVTAGKQAGLAMQSFRVKLEGDVPDLPSLLERCAARFRETSTLPLAASPPVPIPSALRLGDATRLGPRLALELARAQRTGRPLQAAVLWSAKEGEREAQALGHDARRASGSLRPLDGLFDVGRGRFVLLLPSTPADGALTSVRRFLSVLEERNPNAPYLPVQVLLADPGKLARNPTDLMGAALERGDVA